MSQLRVCILQRTQALEVFEGKSFRETLLTASAVSKWDSLAFGAFPGCRPDVLTLRHDFCESDSLRHAMSPFSLFLSSCSGAQSILGYLRSRRIVAVHPPKRGKRRPHLWAAFGGAFELGLRNWPSNAFSAEWSSVWRFVIHKTFLELHNKTASKHSPKQLKLRLFLFPHRHGGE